METRQTMNFWALTALAIGNMIGAGIFLLPSTLAAIGSITFFSWLISAFGTLLLAYVIVDLNKNFRKSGGPFIYAQEAFGQSLGFVVAYNYYLAWVIGNTAMVVASVGYIGTWFPLFHNDPMAAFLLKVFIVWAITAINLLGMKQSSYFQIGTTILKIIPLAAIAFFGLIFLEWSNITGHFNLTGKSNTSALMSGLAITLWAFVGFESAIIASEKTAGPTVVRKATLVAFFTVAILYIAGFIALMGLIPATDLQNSPAPYAAAATLLFGSPWDQFVNFCTVISVLGALNGSVFICVHSAAAASEHGYFPKSFGATNKADTPVKGFIYSGLFMTLLLIFTFNQSLMEQFNFIVLLSTLAYLICYFMVAAGHVALLQEQEAIKLSIKYTIAFLAAMYTFLTMIGAGKDIVFYGIFLFFFAFLLYAFVNKKAIH